jgi:hypothetical protein
MTTMIDKSSKKGEKMTDTQQLDRTYHFIMETFVATGRAPHFTDIARSFSLPPDEGKRFLHDLMNTKLPIWLYPETDLIASFAPFNNLPTQYRLTVDGQQKWFAQ